MSSLVLIRSNCIFLTFDGFWEQFWVMMSNDHISSQFIDNSIKTSTVFLNNLNIDCLDDSLNHEANFDQTWLHVHL